MGCLASKFFCESRITIDVLYLVFETELELERASESQLCYSDAHCLLWIYSSRASSEINYMSHT